MKVYRLQYNNLWKKNILKKSEDNGQNTECE